MSHLLDGNTVALWRFNTITGSSNVGSYSDDSGNGWDLDQAQSGDRTHVQGGPGGVVLGTGSLGGEIVGSADLCIWIDPGNNYVRNLNPGTGFSNNINDSSWSYAAWIYVESFDFGNHQLAFLFGPEFGGTGNANNGLQVRILNPGQNLSFFWQEGNKVSHEVTSSSSALATGSWTHIAVTCQTTGTDWDVTLYVDGIQSGNGTGPYPNASTSDYANADIIISRNFDNTERFHGGIASIALYDEALNSTEVATLAAATSSILNSDARHFALWNFQQEPQGYDHGPYGIHLNARNDSSNANIMKVFGIILDGGYGVLADSTSNSAFRFPRRQKIVDTLLGEWTMEWWTRRGAQDTSDIGFFRYGNPGSSAEEDNHLFSMYVQRTTGDVENQLYCQMENGAGSNEVLSGSTSWWSNTSPDPVNLKHLAMVRRNTGSQCLIDYYRDGVIIDTIGPFTQPTGGDANDIFGLIGCGFDGSATLHEWEGFFDDVRFSDIARSAAEISGSYASGVNGSTVILVQQESVTIEAGITTGSFDRELLRVTYPSTRRRPRLLPYCQVSE